MKICVPVVETSLGDIWREKQFVFFVKFPLYNLLSRQSHFHSVQIFCVPEGVYFLVACPLVFKHAICLQVSLTQL